MKPKKALYISGDIGDVSDGFHTFNELYDHRCTLFVALARSYPSISWRARKHNDGSEFRGWIVAGMNLPGAGQVTYHLPETFWDALDGVETLQAAPAWDGHTSSDVLVRIRKWMESFRRKS